MMKLKDKHSWIDDDKSQTYFELIGDAASRFDNILFIASRSYAHELCFITIYFEGSIYVTVQEASGDQPLLDVNFPDISRTGDGVTLALYDDDGKGNNGPWMKLSVWQVQTADQNDKPDSHSEEVYVSEVEAAEPLSKDLSSDCYVQAYIILKGETDVREVMFRFGNWCYDGNVKLIPKLSLADIPFVIPAVRVQQNKLDFVSEITSLPSSSPFAAAMEHAAQRQPSMQAQAVDSEEYLRNADLHWIEDENIDTFFEFTCTNDGNGALESVDLLAIKSYDPNGIISISIYFGGNWYLVLDEGGGEDFPLLDSKFPDLSRKSLVHNIQSFPDGIDGWPQLRELSICCSNDSRDTEHEQLTTTAKDQSNNDEVPNVSKLESKLENICSGDDSGSTAWYADGKPVEKDCEDFEASCTGENEAKPSIGEVVASGSDTLDDEGDIYAQLDRLDQQLNNEIEGLKELGVLEDDKK